MPAPSDLRTSLQRAGFTHLDGKNLLDSLRLQDSPPADGQSAFNESELRFILESIGLKLGGRQPCWIASRRQLWFGSQPIKQFARLAPHQSAILEAFEAFGWPERIDNPFLATTGGLATAKRRLRRTIDNLNRGMQPGTIRFRGDGSGFGIRWEVSES